MMASSFGGGQQAELVRKIMPLQLLEFGFVGIEMPLLDSDIEIARFQVAVDTVARDALADDVVSRPAHLPKELLCARAVDAREGLLAGNAADHLPAVATRGAPANLAGLDHVHVVAALGEMQCGGDAGKPSAHDAHIGVLLAGQRRKVRTPVRGGRVVGGGVGQGADHGRYPNPGRRISGQVSRRLAAGAASRARILRKQPTITA